jgi:hypothetical protein
MDVDSDLEQLMSHIGQYSYFIIINTMEYFMFPVPTCNMRLIRLARKCSMFAKAESLDCSYCISDIQIQKLHSKELLDLYSSHSISIAKSRIDWTCKGYEDKGNKPLINRPL